MSPNANSSTACCRIKLQFAISLSLQMKPCGHFCVESKGCTKVCGSSDPITLAGVLLVLITAAVALFGDTVGTVVGKEVGKLVLIGSGLGTAVGDLVEIVGPVEEIRATGDRVGTMVPLLALSSDPKVTLDAVEFGARNSGSVMFKGRSDESVCSIIGPPFTSVEVADAVELTTRVAFS